MHGVLHQPPPAILSSRNQSSVGIERPDDRRCVIVLEHAARADARGGIVVPHRIRKAARVARTIGMVPYRMLYI